MSRIIPYLHHKDNLLLHRFLIFYFNRVCGGRLVFGELSAGLCGCVVLALMSKIPLYSEC